MDHNTLSVRETHMAKEHLSKPISGVVRDSLWRVFPFLFGYEITTQGTPPDGSESAIITGYPHSSHLDTIVLTQALKPETSHLVHMVDKKGYWDHPARDLVRRVLVGKTTSVELANPVGIRSLIEVLQPEFAPAFVTLFAQGTRDNPYQAPIQPLVSYLSAVSLAPIHPVWVEGVVGLWDKGVWEGTSLPSKEWWQKVRLGVQRSVSRKHHPVTVTFGEKIDPKEFVATLPEDISKKERRVLLTEAIEFAYMTFFREMAAQRGYPEPQLVEK